MLVCDIPGFKTLRLRHLVLDFNGTLAVDGALLPGVREAIGALSRDLAVHVVTADTRGSAAVQLHGLPVALTILSGRAQDVAKADFVRALGADSVVAVGNGRNDRRMLEVAALGVAVVQEEGASTAAVAAADVVARDLRSALGLLLAPQRLIATLRA